ncbi:high mobility group box domain-containing protein, partial [Gorgonomyces haynaldii]
EETVKPVKRRRAKSTKDPRAPKHPMSAFLFYLTHVRPEYSAKYPGMTVGPISKMISAAWKALTDQERQIYIDRADADKERYATEMQKY